MDSQVFSAFVSHAVGWPDVPPDYVATKLSMKKMFPKLAMGLDSHALLAQSLYHNHGANEVARMAMLNPAHKSGLLSGVKSIAPAVGGVRAMGTNPLRAAASGVLHAKLAGIGFISPAAAAAAHGGTGMLGHATELAGLGILARPSIQKLRGKQVSHANEAKHELLGLGTLAAPSAYHLLTRH